MSVDAKVHSVSFAVYLVLLFLASTTIAFPSLGFSFISKAEDMLLIRKTQGKEIK
jgi:hypothetical protein